MRYLVAALAALILVPLVPAQTRNSDNRPPIDGRALAAFCDGAVAPTAPTSTPFGAGYCVGAVTTVVAITIPACPLDRDAVTDLVAVVSGYLHQHYDDPRELALPATTVIERALRTARALPCGR